MSFTDYAAISTAEPKPTALDVAFWHRVSLRQCLHALGVTDAEMRLQKGAMTVLHNWTGEVDGLLSLASRRWKSLVTRYHEAGSQPNERMWKTVNAAFGAIKHKLQAAIPRTKASQAIERRFRCMVCGNPFVVRGRKRTICGDKCRHERMIQTHRARRATLRLNVIRTCACGCGLKFTPSLEHKRYATAECASKTWRLMKHRNKISHERQQLEV